MIKPKRVSEGSDALSAKILPLNFQRAFNDAVKRAGKSENECIHTAGAMAVSRLHDPSRGYKITVPGDLDFSKYPEIRHHSDLPSFLSIEGNMIIPEEKLPALIFLMSGAKSIDVRGNIIVQCTGNRDARAEKIYEDLMQIHSCVFAEAKIEFSGESSPPDIIKTIHTRAAETVVRKGKFEFDPFDAATSKMAQDEYANFLMTNPPPAGGHIYEPYDELTRRPELREMTDKQLSSALRQKEALDPTQLQRFQKLLTTEFETIFKKSPSGVKPIPDEHGALSDGFHNFAIGRDTHVKGTPRHKGYVTLSNPIEEFTPEHFSKIVHLLASGGFNGQFKIPQDYERFLLRFDNIVLHGATEADVQRGLQIVTRYLSDSHVRICGQSRGIDKDGKSHTELLARKVKLAWIARKRKGA